MATREQKIEELAGFLELNAQSQIDGHSAHDGIGCVGHREAFDSVAADLLKLIEDGYGYGESAGDELEAADS